MSKLVEVTNNLLESASIVSNTYNDYISREAKLSTQNKQIQMQADINSQLAAIKQSSDYEHWQDNINTFFEKIKDEMSNPQSKYYCKNNMQGEMFTQILEENRLGVTEKVNQMVMQREMERDVVNVQNSKVQLAQMYSGQDYIDKANELDKGLYEAGRISLEQYESQIDLNVKHGYENVRTKTFDDSLNDAFKQNKSFEEFWTDIENNMPELRATDASGLEKAYDEETLNNNVKKACKQKYNAALADMQQKNADALSEIVQSMRQANTAQGKLAQARRGQMAMNNMKGLQLSEADRLKYSAYFEMQLDSGNGRGSGSGSKAPNSSYENLVKAAPDEALQMLVNNDDLIPYDAAKIISDRLLNNWFGKNYKENYDKDYGERIEAYDSLYEYRTSKETLTDAMLNKLVKKYPTAADYLKNNCSKLITDIQKNPKEYGTASVGELADFMCDWIMGAGGNATDEDFVKALKQHVNDCYIERIKYVELDKKGNVAARFNANKASDIAKAAILASSKDFVFTDTKGNERWAEGKKEALEAPGGVVNVLQNAVVGTLGIPESEYGEIGFYYKPDEKSNDLKSTPIITYKDKAYEVIADDDGKGFKIRDINSGEELEGKTGGKLKQVMREGQKEEAKHAVLEAHRTTSKLRKEREAETNKAITESKTMPKAMKATGQFEQEEWDTIPSLEDRQYKLNVTINKIENDAKKVKNNKISEDEFKKKYNISYSDWAESLATDYRYNLILKS